MSPGPRAVEVFLSNEEHAELSHWAGGAVPPRLAERARIVLACTGGAPNARVAAELGVSADTVRKWRSRFVSGTRSSPCAAVRSNTWPNRRGEPL
ncbi:helix-turn-helix domain-containing protein [Streptosporangium canum]|uniref:helix-turn-helix domain-containing protein n=1 Tax=Streptosporangium canum TaxID=324952 RepID=UPI00343137B8